MKKQMAVFFIIFFIVVFIGIPGALWTFCWGIGRLLGFVWPAAAPIGKWAGTVIASCLLAVFLFGFIFGWRMTRVRRIELAFRDLPASFDGYSIAHLSDWHLGTYSKNHKTIRKEVEKVLEAKPDIILFTGDIVNGDPEELAPFMSLLSSLYAPDGVWSVMGNHDYCVYYPDNTPEKQRQNILRLQEMENRMGWKMLLNAGVMISNGKDSIAVIGVENDGQPPFPQYGDLRKAQAGLPEGIFKILMSHDPTHWRRSVLPETDIQLTLSGHTHAMQFRIGRFSPSMLHFKEWGGLYSEGERRLFVSTGSGGNIPFRFGAWPEVDFITLRSL